MSLIRYPSPDICSPVVKQNSDLLYAQGFTAIMLLLIQGLRALRYLLLLAVAFVLWTWRVSFQTGRHLGRWIESEKPDTWQQTYKFFEMLGFPVVVIADWSRLEVKKLGIELPQLPLDPPGKCSDLLPSAKNNS